jgi:N6-adenosine-specific RNA methylase IME4
MNVVDFWAKKITNAWRDTVESALEGIFETGRLLNDAKRELNEDGKGHGKWLALIETPGKLPFKKRTAQHLMQIAAWAEKIFPKAQCVALLPPHWGTLYEITKLSDDVFFAKLADGTINPEMQRKDVARENRLLSRARDEARVLDLVATPGRYRTLVIDPPWDYEWLSLAGRAAPGYATMTHEELLALPVESWAEDHAHLYLWVTNNFMTRGVELMARWGFAHKTVLTWVKPRWGLGSYFRNSTEHVLFGVRGELMTRSSSIATHFEAPVAGHSEKPDRFYEIVREASYGSFGEAFQRKAREGFSNIYRQKEAAA